MIVGSMTVMVMSHLFIGFIPFTLKRIQLLQDIQRLPPGEFWGHGEFCEFWGHHT